MSTHQPTVPPVPADIDRMAHYGYEPDNFYLRIGDRLEQLLDGFDAEQFRGATRSSAPPHALALLTVFQSLEDLSDSQTVQELRTRLDWRYALHLPLRLPPISARTLSEFRRRLRNSRDALQILDRVERCLNDLRASQERTGGDAA